MKRADPSLLWIVASRIVVFSVIAIVIQAGFIFHDYWTNNSRVARHMIEEETDALSAGLSAEAGQLSFTLPEALRHRYAPITAAMDSAGNIRPGYYVKVSGAGERLLFANCAPECLNQVFPAVTGLLPRWLKLMSAEHHPITAAGGKTYAASVPGLGGAEIAVAIIGDPEQLIWKVIGSELLNHMVIPMLDILVLVVLATIFFIRSALKPVTVAAAAIDAMHAPSAFRPIDLARMPREIAVMGHAMNLAFGRVRELLDAQRIFAGAVSHELRTPIAIARLELEKVADPRVSKVIDELDDMTHVVEQLTQLARLENSNGSRFAEVDLGAVAQSSVARLAPYVYSKSHSLEFADEMAGQILAIPGLLEILLANLVENAVRHTPGGTHIIVQAGPGAQISVSDDGGNPGNGEKREPRMPGAAPARERPGIGLKIVQRIADLHGAQFVITTLPGKGTSTALTFAAGRKPVG